MAKLTTQEIRNSLINSCYAQGPEFCDQIAKQFLQEIKRIYKDQFLYNNDQIELQVKHLGNYQSIITQYFFMRSDKWLRQQHKVWSKQTA